MSIVLHKQSYFNVYQVIVYLFIGIKCKVLYKLLIILKIINTVILKLHHI